MKAGVRYLAWALFAGFGLPMTSWADIDLSELEPKRKESVAAAKVPAPSATPPTAQADDDVNAADRGDREAQYRLGLRYDQGRGVGRDLAQAARWYEKAALQGHSDAQTNLALMYRDGQGVAKDPVEAVKWLRLATRQGNPRAQYILGLIAYEGTGGTPRSLEAAYKLWLSAAAQGHAGAMNNLAVMHGLGQGVEQSDVEAFAWFALAARLGDQSGLENMRLSAQELSPDDLARAQSRAEQLAQKLDL